MARDVRLANNYLRGALPGTRAPEKVTRPLLNALAGSPNKEVKQFAHRAWSRLVAQYLQQQQQRLAAPGSGRRKRDPREPDPT